MHKGVPVWADDTMNCEDSASVTAVTAHKQGDVPPRFKQSIPTPFDEFPPVGQYRVERLALRIHARHVRCTGPSVVQDQHNPDVSIETSRGTCIKTKNRRDKAREGEAYQANVSPSGTRYRRF